MSESTNGTDGNGNTIPDGMRIIRFEADDVLRLKAVRISPSGDLIVIGGENSQGKTSVLNCIEMALAGGEMPRLPIRTGKTKGKIVVDLGDSALDESKAAPVAFMLYELLPKRFDVLNFAVDPQWRRRGVATRMMTHMQKKCRFNTDRGLKGRTEIMLSVSEWNNGCIAFLRKLGFQGTGVQRDTIAMTDGTSCDSYGFRWTLPEVRQ